MTYAALIVPFVLLTVIVTALSARRPGIRRRLTASALAAIGLVLLTAVFDNVMIALDLFTYPPEHLSGLRIGLAPLEDFSYPVCAAFLVPAVHALLTPRPAGHAGPEEDAP
ncbi:lycopene cyclase domain-containing protein [Microbacterium telephonicum]|uniref:Lycopene cyclase domain-containing protein n=1 Tax=Microbacterium telephonicum TaxID=1714841 RepID=A0A498C0F8_9MICO|nr:lycopene cyclase domain-containing protein [Microbacterium telephonicum]RLK49112.1 lycopene cyclase domain-containing protein [Microbacterium telephonicum]